MCFNEVILFYLKAKRYSLVDLLLARCVPLRSPDQIDRGIVRPEREKKRFAGGGKEARRVCPPDMQCTDLELGLPPGERANGGKRLRGADISSPCGFGSAPYSPRAHSILWSSSHLVPPLKVILRDDPVVLSSYVARGFPFLYFLYLWGGPSISVWALCRIHELRLRWGPVSRKGTVFSVSRVIPAFRSPAVARLSGFFAKLFGSLCAPPPGAVSTLPGHHKTPVTIPGRRPHPRLVPPPGPISGFPVAGVVTRLRSRSQARGLFRSFFSLCRHAERCQ
ncbi:hypothetical protein NDU88_004161 [Pleurodeles waltl]|uniref:Uncharacterized protein n=1 Tax=Pleurodeles waltl TaxID=8319 RepID=A0AAV7PBN9_PLEWA|nr:hypothetical protein NDU88_004161 [Pleurodeles waltl]